MNCFQLLGLPEAPTLEQVKQAWRLAAGKHHPDRGGDPALFDQLRQAYQDAMAEVARPKPCSECGGRGKLKHAHGWAGIDLVCNHCNGTGAAR
jgi:DnaJ-class molecular chaperone